jgi:hypothetical protein
MPSQKTAVVDHLWDVLQAEGDLRPLTFDDVKAAIIYCNQKFGTNLSSSNPANFMKDLLRGRNASENWPPRLTGLRIAGRQVKGENRIFEFVHYDEGQQEPFPSHFDPQGDEVPILLQSVSLPLATKSLGRVDESWLVQVAVNLRVLEAHFANKSELDIQEVTHLQVGVKLGKSEIDSLFLAVVQGNDGRRFNALVTCEAKQARDTILADQIVQQIVSANTSVQRVNLGIEMIIPVAIKAVMGGCIYVVEFEPWSPADASANEDELKSLEVHSTGLYQLRPPVPGVGYQPSLAKRAPRKPKV